MTDHGRLVRLRIRSAFEMLDLVQVVSDDIARLAGLDEDGIHWTGVAIRESVINAIKHGNRQDQSKAVTIEFAFEPDGHPSELVIRVTDQGEGFDVSQIGDPLAPENMLKSSGRGIFFMRSFMDDVVMQRAPHGGMEVRLVKRLPAAPPALSGVPKA